MSIEKFLHSSFLLCFSPRGYAPTDGSSTVAKIAADLRPSTVGLAIRTSLVTGGG